MSVRKTQAQYDQELIDKNTGVKRLGEYKGRNIKIWHLCICENKWLVIPGSVLTGVKCGCGRRMNRFESDEICGNPIGLAKRTGADRGTCIRKKGHRGCHGSGTCAHCGATLFKKDNSLASQPHGLCTPCSTLNMRAFRGPRRLIIVQEPGIWYTFDACGCSGFLPSKGQSNRFASLISTNGIGWTCRVDRTLRSSQRKASEAGYKSMDPNIPHSVIRAMMEKPLCWRCKQSLDWTFGNIKTPHLHHNHETGEIYGYTHNRCNRNMLEDENKELRDEITARIAYERFLSDEIDAAGIWVK